MSAGQRLYVNLPLGYSFAPLENLEGMAVAGVWPEWGLDNVLLDEAAFAHFENMAGRMRTLGLSCSVHFPFSGIRPSDPDRIGPTDAALDLAALAARIFAPDLLISHPYLDTSLPPAELDRAVKTGAEAYRALMDRWPGHPPLYLENTHETFPEPLAELAAAIDSPKAGVCFDLGHWHGFADGAALGNLDRWLDVLAPHIRHLHLHDNDGSGDQHLGLGLGAIPWEAFFEGLRASGIRPTATLEPHSLEDFQASAAFISRHPDWFAPLGSLPRA